MGERELHIVAISGDEDPRINNGNEKILKTAQEIVGFLKPARLLVVSGVTQEVSDTAKKLHGFIGEDYALDKPNRCHALDTGSLNGDENKTSWRIQMEIMNKALMFKAERENAGYELGLALVTSPDIVEGVPGAYGASGYDAEVDTDYLAANYLTIVANETTGSVLKKDKART